MCGALSDLTQQTLSATGLGRPRPRPSPKRTQKSLSKVWSRREPSSAGVGGLLFLHSISSALEQLCLGLFSFESMDLIVPSLCLSLSPSPSFFLGKFLFTDGKMPYCQDMPVCLVFQLYLQVVLQIPIPAGRFVDTNEWILPMDSRKKEKTQKSQHHISEQRKSGDIYSTSTPGIVVLVKGRQQNKTESPGVDTQIQSATPCVHVYVCVCTCMCVCMPGTEARALCMLGLLPLSYSPSPWFTEIGFYYVAQVGLEFMILLLLPHYWYCRCAPTVWHHQLAFDREV